MRMTYLLLAAARSGLAFTIACLMRSAWSAVSQKTMVLAKRLVVRRNSETLAATSSVRFSRMSFFEVAQVVFAVLSVGLRSFASRCEDALPRAGVLPRERRVEERLAEPLGATVPR